MRKNLSKRTTIAIVCLLNENVRTYFPFVSTGTDGSAFLSTP